MADFELINEIKTSLREEGGIKVESLEFSYEGPRLFISGTVYGEDQVQLIEQVLSDYMDEGDYDTELDVTEPDETEYVTSEKSWDDDYDSDEEDFDNIDGEENASTDDDEF